MTLPAAVLEADGLRLVNLKRKAWACDLFPVTGAGPHAAIYARVSTPGQTIEDDTSLADQIAECNGEAERRDWTIRAVYWDVLSGATHHRRGFQALLKDIREGVVDGVLAWKDDRLCRGMFPAAALNEALETRAATFPIVYLHGNPFSRRTLSLMAWVAGEERQNLIDRGRLGRKASARHGKVPAGQPPYGYQRGSDGTLTVCSVEHPWLKEMARRVVAGEPLERIAHDFTSRGAPKPRQHPPIWSGAFLRHLRGSPAVYGERHYRIREDEGVKTFILPVPEPVMTKAKWDNQRDRRQRQARGRSAINPPALSRLLRCAVCGLKVAAITQTTCQTSERRPDGSREIRKYPLTPHAWPTDARHITRSSAHRPVGNRPLFGMRICPAVWEVVKQAFSDPQLLEQALYAEQASEAEQSLPDLLNEYERGQAP